MHRLVRYAMIASLIAAVVAWWMKDALPPAARILENIHDEPKQARVTGKPLDITVNGVNYSIHPRYAYELHGLVVSTHDSDTWWDYAHKAASDHINVVDLCVVWGATAKNGGYKGISFSNNQWECHWSSRSNEAWAAFDQTEVSNNHMVTSDPAVAKALRSVSIGDQIRVVGYLVDYTTYAKDGRPAGKRVSSETRTDTGNGACEVLFIESLQLLDSAGRGWRLGLKIALGALLLSVIAWLFMPVKFND
jgi:hypothetical protein